MDRTVNLESCTIQFTRNRAEYTLNYPYCLENNTLTKLKKLFEAMCFEYWRKDNAEAIKKTKSMLNSLVRKYENGRQKGYISKIKYERMCKKQNAFIEIADKFNATRVIDS